MKIFHYFKKKSYKLFAIKVTHLVLTVIVFYFSFLLFRYGSLVRVDPYGFRYNYFVTILYGGLIVFFNRTYNAYLLGYTRIRQLVSGQVLSQFFSIILLYILVSIAWNKTNNPIIFIPMLCIQLIIDLVWSYYANFLFYKLNGKHKTLLIYRNALDRCRLEM